jgi:membrane associated rhomboid family serine protease
MTPAPVGLRCPEHSGKPQGIRKVTVAAERVATGSGSRYSHPITSALIAINTAVLLIEFALGGSSDGTNNWIYYHGVLISNAEYASGALAGVANGEWWRLITSAFLHEGVVHLAVNMLSLFFCGRILEMVIGRWRFLTLYLVAAVAGSAGALYLSPNSPTLGASGAIFGVLGALLVLEYRGVIHTGGQILLWIVLNLVFTFSISGISIGGHIGGLICGVVLMFLWLQFRSSTRTAVLIAAAVLAVSVIFAYAVI